MPYFDTLRFNTELLGRLMEAKMTGTDRIEVQCNKNAKIQSTVDRPIKYPTFRDWFDSIKSDAKLLENAQIEARHNRNIMDGNMEYHYNWLQAKFKTN